MSSSVFSNKKAMPLLALMCALLWALAYPLIKLGYQELGILSDDLGSKILFAGIRFTVAGLIVLAIFTRSHKSNMQGGKKIWAWLVLYALVNTFLHYVFSYIGLGYIPSARGTVLDSTGTFFLILLSCMFFKDDKMTLGKALGCILGFAGIVILNLSPGKKMFENITFLGDGMILLNAVSAAFGGILSRIMSKKTDMTMATGIGMAIGGGILVLVGLIVGPARAWTFTPLGIGILIVLTLISSVCFSVYNLLLANHPISKVAIFNAFIPVFGVIFAALLVGETLQLRYFVAALVIVVGTYLANLKG